METIKLNITIDETNWLEATWSNDETALHRESFSGHPEHIAMLEAKAIEFGTDLKEFSDLIKQAKDMFVLPSEEELAKEELQHKIQEAEAYLNSTEWVKDYKLRHDLGLEILPEDSTKWLIIKQREEYITFLKGAK